MHASFKKTMVVIPLVVLAQGANSLEASRLKQAAALAAGLAVLVSGQPWLPQPMPPESLGLEGQDFDLAADLRASLEEADQECSHRCGRDFDTGLIQCETLPPVLRNFCLTRIMAADEACMAKCLGEAGTAFEASH